MLIMINNQLALHFFSSQNIPFPYLIFLHKSHAGLRVSHLQHKDTCFSLIVGSCFLKGFIPGEQMSFEVRTEHLRTITWIFYFPSTRCREGSEEKIKSHKAVWQCKCECAGKSVKSRLQRRAVKTTGIQNAGMVELAHKWIMGKGEGRWHKWANRSPLYPPSTHRWNLSCCITHLYKS